MTLVLTEASALGIAMAADSSATFPKIGRSLLGLQKLLPVRSMNAGISFWGAASVGEQHMDIWLQGFIQNQVKSDMTLWQVAEALATSLNKAFSKPLDINSGMHIAGYDIDDSGNKYPAIYHVHNGHLSVGEINGKIVLVPHEPIHGFVAYKDYPPQPIKNGDTFTLRNGDISVFVQLYHLTTHVFSELQPKLDLVFPYPAKLETRGEYLRLWISFISQIYRHSNIYPRNLDVPITGGGAHIGGPISVLTIDSQGIRTYYTV